MVERVGPEYPPDAEREGIEGEVILQVRIEVDGSTTHLKTVRPLHLCTEAAVAAAEKWRWEPAKKDGEAVAATGIVTVRFPPGSEERR
ncbi:MAG: energy transducer TonB [Vicinamibacteria bacterium]